MDDLKLIKKYYGEKMMHLCREFFSTLLETPGLLSDLMLKNFEPSKFLYEDLVKNEKIYEFKDYIYSLKESKKIEKSITNTPQELLSVAGYDLYECKSEEDIQSFKKYYKKGEELCTFKGNRLERCHVFFAVKKNVEEIKRENFKNPERQDEYGTSVISIQFSRGKNQTLSIKNRYNHTVTNPDATFSNNLDNIIPGLTDSFEQHYNLNLSNNKVSFEIPGYVKGNDGKYYKYNYEINNIYYCPNNIIIDNFVVKKDYQEMERYIIFDYFILDLKEKTIKLYDSSIKDSFIDGLNNLEKTEIIRDKNTGDKEILIKCVEGTISLKIDKENNIIKYSNDAVTNINDNFLKFNKKLKNISIPNVKIIKDHFLNFNEELCEINVPNLSKIGSSFLHCNKKLKSLYLPNVEEISNNFLLHNEVLEVIILPKVKEIQDDFLSWNKKLESINLPSVEKIGNNFLMYNNSLKTINFPKVEKIGNAFLSYNKSLKTIKLATAEEIGASFLCNNTELEEAYLPKVKKISEKFLKYNNKIKVIKFDFLESVGTEFMRCNNTVEKVELPRIISIGDEFLYCNEVLNEILLPRVKYIYEDFLESNNSLEKIILPNAEIIGRGFLKTNKKLRHLEIPKANKIGGAFLLQNKNLEKLIIPKYTATFGEFFPSHPHELHPESNLKWIKFYNRLNVSNSYKPSAIIKILNSITPNNKIVCIKKANEIINNQVCNYIKNKNNKKVKR